MNGEAPVAIPMTFKNTKFPSVARGLYTPPPIPEGFRPEFPDSYLFLHSHTYFRMILVEILSSGQILVRFCIFLAVIVSTSPVQLF
jgi:hypothetical protein